ncbi:MAG: gamma-glutamyl-gamma-aminobutyrate hydrolase family protein [Syntrophaceae bacterium]|nr:gamma-glutamyl-gamma-aminobutyrate hydrolase family protein [Syntrophaceae bacterium]
MISISPHEEAVTLRGLLIDLELGPPDTSRFQELKTNICEKLDLRASDGTVLSIALEHQHFSEIDRVERHLKEYHFIILSPQGTPWRSYTGGSGAQLEVFRGFLVKTIRDSGVPVLGICGGHQFLAMSFGARVDFIDPCLIGKSPEKYPESALAERGMTTLHVLREDPIFSGMAHHSGKFQVIESHTEEVKNTPHGFVNLARSDLSEIQLITIPDSTVYGMAFHPERGWDHIVENGVGSPAGKVLLCNFFELVYQKMFKGA